MLLPLKHKITYGPVPSRRLGRSLGINLLPPGRKVCSFDCQYCQYGFAQAVAELSPGSHTFSTPTEVQDAVEAALAGLAEPPRWLTFSGNGEPTLYPYFPEIVERILALRDRVVPGARTAILSNSTQVGHSEIREALARLDARIMKLDAGTQAGFERYNQPASGLRVDTIVDGLIRLGNLTLQSLFTGGPSGNLDRTEVEGWLAAVAKIRPVMVQLYTLDRESPNQGLLRARSEQLQDLQERLLALGIPSTVYPGR
jgi:wyosine [tRNA(Phe)-imidazoG37] synthetase (radical SAM superfamily)